MADPVPETSPVENASPPLHASPQNARPSSSFRGCSRITDYPVIRKLGEGTFGEVHSARSKKTGEVVALKKILMHNEKDGFPITALREIKLLKLLCHDNVLKLEDMAIEHHQKSTDKRKRAIVYMVTPYMDHDLSGLLENPSVTFSEPQIKCYMMQLLQGTAYLHDNHILHRDMKAANLLINNKGILQIADFGLARHYDEPVPVAGQGGGEARREYTTLVVTRWYRPPELLMQLRKYTTAIDLWGVGCVFGEMLIGKPILAGDSDTNQLRMVFDLVGSPTEETMPNWRSLPGAEGLNFPARPSTLGQRFREYGSGAISLLNELLKLDWKKRSNAIDALKHPYFRNSPLPAKPGDLPTYEESHELDRRKFRSQKAAPPPAPKGGGVGTGLESANGSQAHIQNGDPHSTHGHRNHHQNGSRHPPPPPPPPHGAPHSGHRNGGPHPPALDERKPAWQRDSRDRPDTRLPPRPPPVDLGHAGYDPPRPERDSFRSRSRDLDRDRPPIPRGRINGAVPHVDTYIPSYGPDSGRPPRERDDRERERPPRDDRDRRRRDDRGERRPERERGEYDERERERRTGAGGAMHAARGSRSRSPGRSRERERVREREPLERDHYRR